MDSVNVDIVRVGDSKFHVKGLTLKEAAEEGVERYLRAAIETPSLDRKFHVTVERDGKTWHWTVEQEVKLVARSLDVAAFRERERAVDKAG